MRLHKGKTCFRLSQLWQIWVQCLQLQFSQPLPGSWVVIIFFPNLCSGIWWVIPDWLLRNMVTHSGGALLNDPISQWLGLLGRTRVTDQAACSTRFCVPAGLLDPILLALHGLTSCGSSSIFPPNTYACCQFLWIHLNSNYFCGCVSSLNCL